MTAPTTITFIGAKGGVGTSTVAALHAVQQARLGRTVRLTAKNGTDDLAAILGVPATAPGDATTVMPGLTLADERCVDSDNVVDAGTDCFSEPDGALYLVVRNDYLSLRRALNAPRTTTGIVLVTEPNRSLGRRDVEDVLGHPIVAELRLDPAIARAVDAGLLSSARHLRVDLSLRQRPSLGAQPVEVRAADLSAGTTFAEPGMDPVTARSVTTDGDTVRVTTPYGQTVTLDRDTVVLLVGSRAPQPTGG